MEMSKGCIRLLGKFWKIGWISRFYLSGEFREELRRFGVIDVEIDGKYFINKDVYSKLVSGKQLTLNSHEKI